MNALRIIIVLCILGAGAQVLADVQSVATRLHARAAMIQGR